MPPPAPPAVRSLIDTRAAGGGIGFVEGVSGRSLEWAELPAHADRWRMAAAALAPGDRVGLRMADPLAMIPALLAALATGLVVAPLDPDCPPAELTALVRALGLSAVAGDDGSADVLADAEVPALVVSGAELRFTRRAARRDLVPPTAGSGSVAASAGSVAAGAGSVAAAAGAGLLLASSGTSGQRKLIVLSETQLLHTASCIVAHHGLTPDDVGYSPLPLHHINGVVVGALASLVGGHRLVVDRRFSASAFWDVVGRHRATWVNLVPAIIAVLAAAPAPGEEVAGRVAFARSASAPLPVPILRRFEQHTGIPVVETYGMTEAASQITANHRPPGRRKEGTVGVAVGVELHVVDPADRAAGALAPGAVGEVEIRGRSVVERYMEPVGSANPWRPARAADGWLPTGDLGFLDGDGYLTLVGRADDVINRGGEKVHPREVEDVLLAHPGVAAAAVVARPHPTVGEEPVAFVVPATDPAGDPAGLVAELNHLCQRHLSRFRRPASITLVDALPAGTNGKVRRAELRRRLADPAAGAQDGAA